MQLLGITITMDWELMFQIACVCLLLTWLGVLKAWVFFELILLLLFLGLCTHALAWIG